MNRASGGGNQVAAAQCHFHQGEKGTGAGAEEAVIKADAWHQGAFVGLVADPGRPFHLAGAL